MRTPRRLSAGVPPLFPIGLGCMAMSGMYGHSDRKESIATIHAAIDAGIQLFDTGDFYGMGHNEMLLGDALAGRDRSTFFVQVKFGAQREPNGAWIGYDARPAAVKTALAYTLQRLRMDYVDLYQPARLDPKVPIEETVGAIQEMIDAGYVRHVGLSEMGVNTIKRAQQRAPVASLQIEYSLMSRGIERDILPATKELGIGITAYGILSRGMIGGKTSASMTPDDFRSRLPRRSGANEARNLAMVEKLAAFARERRATTAQLAMAWVLARGEHIIGLAGARTRAQLTDLLGALDVRLSESDGHELERIIDVDTVAGERYDRHQMAVLDSEK